MTTHRTIITGAALLLLLASAVHAQREYDPFAYDPWFDAPMENPLENYYEDSQREWDRMQEEWDRRDRQRERDAQRLQNDLDRLMNPPRDPLVDYYQRRDEERSHSLSACMGIHSNPAAQQRCLDMLPD